MELSYGDLALKFTVVFIFMVIQINMFGKGNLAPTNAIDAPQNYVLAWWNIWWDDLQSNYHVIAIYHGIINLDIDSIYRKVPDKP